MAKLVLAVVGYGHFFIEHNKGHHRDVATPMDPATSRMGESIYSFSLREIPGAFKRAWDLEEQRLSRCGKSVWSLENEVLQPMILTAVLYAGLLAFFGPLMLIFLPIQMAFGWWQLTSANYIEHYGLLREKMSDGRYERQQPHHSWNSNHIMSNLILFHLQRHSDHHAPSYKVLSIASRLQRPAFLTIGISRDVPGRNVSLMVSFDNGPPGAGLG